MIMCLNCFESYCECDKIKVDIDREIFPTIRTLNKKGYYTEYCCGGHIEDLLNPDHKIDEDEDYLGSIPYILFHYSVKDLDVCPSLFRLEYKEDIYPDTIIRGLQIDNLQEHYNSRDYKTIKDRINRLSINLRVWSESLPTRRQISYDNRIMVSNFRHHVIKQSILADIDKS